MPELFLVFLGFSALGIAAMAPSVTFGDAGEFAAAAAAWAIPHAPGYPLYTVMGKALGTAVPLGSWAYRTNLFSALAAAAALAVLADALRHAGFSRLARYSGIALLGLSPVWRYASGVTEVFALHALALSCLVWLAFRFAGRFWEDRPMAALGLVCGLGMANHQTLALAVPAVLWEAWATSPARAPRILRGLSVSALFFLLGLLVYLCLPLRSALTPPLDWGHPVDWPRFLHVFLRKDYGSLSLTVEGQAAQGRLAAVGAQALRFVSESRAAMGLLALFLALAGSGVWRGRSVSLRLPAAWIVLTGPFFLCLGNPPFDAQTSGALERFFIAPCVGLAILAAGALQRLSEKGTTGRAAAAALALAMLVPGASALSRWNERGDLAAYDYGRSVVKSLPPGAALYMDGGDDTFYSLAFLDFAQGIRPDLELHDRGGLVFRSAYGWDFRKLDADSKEVRRRGVESIAAQQDRLFYSTFKDRIVDGYELRPWGLLKKAVKVRSQENADLWQLYPYRWSDEALAAHYRDRALVALYPTLRGAQSGDSGVAWLRQAWAIGPDVLWLKPNTSYILGVRGFESSQRKDWPAAEKALSLASRIDPGNADAALNLGVVYEKTGRLKEAEAAYRSTTVLSPGSSQAYYNLGAMYWGQQRWNEAADSFARAAALKPGDLGLANWAKQARSKVR